MGSAHLVTTIDDAVATVCCEKLALWGAIRATFDQAFLFQPVTTAFGQGFTQWGTVGTAFGQGFAQRGTVGTAFGQGFAQRGTVGTTFGQGLAQWGAVGTTFGQGLAQWGAVGTTFSQGFAQWGAVGSTFSYRLAVDRMTVLDLWGGLLGGWQCKSSGSQQ